MDEELVNERIQLEASEDSQRQTKEDDVYSPKMDSRKLVKSQQPLEYNAILQGKNVVQAVSEAATSQHPYATVEELTVKSYNGSSFDIGTSNSQVQMYNQQKHWQNLYQMTNNSGNGNSLSDIGLISSGQATSSAWEDIGSTSFPELLARKSHSDGQSNAIEHLAAAESKEGAGDVHRGMRTKVLSKSGFAEYFIKNSLKSKGVVHKGPSSDRFYVQSKEKNQEKAGSGANQNWIKTSIGADQNQMKTSTGIDQKQMKTGIGAPSNSSKSVKYDSKTANFPFHSDASVPKSSMTECDGVTLREWLKSGQRKEGKMESFTIFRKIVDLVDDSHSRGIALHNLCPSYIKLLPSNQVMYIGLPTQTQMAGSVVNPEVLNLDNSFIRKRVSEQVTSSSVDMESKKQKIDESLRITGSDLCVETANHHKVQIPTVGSQYEKDKRFSPYNFGRMSSIPCVSNTGEFSYTSLCERWENKWYANPEGVCTTSSNIYCLGVLFFELLVHFDSKKAHTATNLLSSIAKIDSCYYPETLHQMYIVNAGTGFKKMLWPAAQKFLDPKTTAKIQILESKSLYKLQEVIDSSQLPDFLGGSCTCSRDGGCLRTNKGPWNDHNIMKLVRNAEGTFVRQITRASNEQHNFDPFQLQSLKERCSGSSTAESGSDFNDYSSPTRQRSGNYPRLAPVREEVRAPDANGYYSCDDSALSAQNVIESDQFHLTQCSEPKHNDK